MSKAQELLKIVEADYRDTVAKSKEITAKDPEMDKRIIPMAQRTWETIAGDIFDAMGGGKMKQLDVIEAVCDADYMFTYGRDPEAYAYFL